MFAQAGDRQVERAADRIDHEVYAAPIGQAANLRLHILRAVVDCLVESKLPQARDTFLARHGRQDTRAGAEREMDGGG